MLGALLILAAASGAVDVYRDNEWVGGYANRDRAMNACAKLGPGACLLSFGGERTAVVTIPEYSEWVDGKFNKIPIPEIAWEPPTRFIPAPENGQYVYVCNAGSRGTTAEPDGNDMFNGMSVEGAVNTLSRAVQVARRVQGSILSCEGGLYDRPEDRVRIDWSGTESRPVGLVGPGGTPGIYFIYRGRAYIADPKLLCGATFGRWKEQECPADSL